MKLCAQDRVMAHWIGLDGQNKSWNRHYALKLIFCPQNWETFLAKNSNMAAQLIRLEQKPMQAYWLTEDEHICQGLDICLQ